MFRPPGAPQVLRTPGSRGRLTSAKRSSAAVLQAEKPTFTSNPPKIRSSGKQGGKLQAVECPPRGEEPMRAEPGRKSDIF